MPPGDPHLQRDPYRLLGVSSTASQDEIKRAYHRLTWAAHPDRVAEPQRERATGRQAELNQAYALLSNPAARARLDRARRAPPPRTGREHFQKQRAMAGTASDAELRRVHRHVRDRYLREKREQQQLVIVCIAVLTLIAVAFATTTGLFPGL